MDTRKGYVWKFILSWAFLWLKRVIDMQPGHFANESNGPMLLFFPVIKYWSLNNEPPVLSCRFDKCLYHPSPIMKLWLIFNIRTISIMDIALQLSFLLHPQWHYITTLCNNGIVITEDEREGGVLFWGSVSGHWSADHENEQLLREIYISELIYWGSMRHPRVQK